MPIPSAITRLRLSMISMLALIIGLATLILTAIMFLLLPQYDLSIIIVGSLALIVALHVIQWLVGPKLLEAVYKVRPLRDPRLQWVRDMVSRISERSGLSKVPEVMVAGVDIPNAFAYGNVFTGYKVAVTDRLLKTLPPDEVEAVLAHEIGHIKHRDVELMMLISILPALIFWLGRVMMMFGWFGERRREGSAAIIPLIGLALMAISFVFNLFILYVSRLREYYADTHAALTVSHGATRLQRALARIMIESGLIKRHRPEALISASSFKAFLISDPDAVVRTYGFTSIDEVVEWIKSRPRLMPTELFSTHPDPAKRFRYLDKVASELITTPVF